MPERWVTRGVGADDVANTTGESLAGYMLDSVEHHLWDALEQLKHYCEILWTLHASLL